MSTDDQTALGGTRCLQRTRARLGARAIPRAHAGSDTLPATVAKRSLEAYNRHDLTALQSNYDTVFTHELLGDSAAKYTGTPPQMFAGMSDYFAKNKVRAVLKQQIVSGRYVVQLY